jgi:hypothetical protein
MNNQEFLSRITIPAPCPEDWRRMRGNKRTRHCDLCGKKVHNLRAMTSEEVVALVKASDGELCGLVTRGEDGALVTADYGRRPFRQLNPWQFKISDLMALVAATAAVFGIIRPVLLNPIVTAGRMRITPIPPGVSAQCTETDPAEELEPEECPSDRGSSVPEVPTPGEQP